MFASPLKWLFILAPLVMVFVISFGIQRLRPATAQLLFWAFAALMGISLSSIFLVYTHTSIVRVFFITAAIVRRAEPVRLHHQARHDRHGLVPDDGPVRRHHRQPGQPLPGLARRCSSSISVVGVLVFAGLTAWDTQRLKNEYIYGYAGEGDEAERSAISGALSLYLNFINLFTLLMQLLGQRE